MKVTLIAATLNENDAVRVVLPQIDRQVVDEIIVADGGSTDGTVEYCESHGYTVYRQKAKGYGSAIKEAVALAQGDIIIEFPPDGNSPPDRIKDVVEKIKEGNDFVIASRYLKGSRSDDDDFFTAIGNWGFTKLTNILFLSRYSDVLIGFRGYKKSSYQKLNMWTTGLDWSIQMPIQFRKKRMKVAEIPCVEPKRIGGVRKMSPIKTGLKILDTIIKERLQKD